MTFLLFNAVLATVSLGQVAGTSIVQGFKGYTKGEAISIREQLDAFSETGQLLTAGEIASLLKSPKSDKISLEKTSTKRRN